MIQFDTVEELVKKRKGYKYLNKDMTSPYKGYKYDLSKKILTTSDLDEDLNNCCGPGWNLATLDWILKDATNLLNSIIVEFSIPSDAKIIVPKNTYGKFRVDIIKYEKKYTPEKLFPKIKPILKKLKKYKSINPIVAEKMPRRRTIKNILKRIGDPVRDQVVDPVRGQVWDQVRGQVWDQVVGQVWDQIRDQVVDQVRVAGYLAVKEFIGIDYEHPAFDLIRLGVIVVDVLGKTKVYGKNGKYLGDV